MLAACHGSGAAGPPDLTPLADARKGPGDAGSCGIGPGYGGHEPSVQVTSVSATLFDQNGAVIADSPVQVCGLDLCFPGTTGIAGTVTVSPDHVLMRPALLIGDSLAYVKLAVPVNLATTTFSRLVTVALPAMGAAFQPGGDAVSGGVTLSLPAGGRALVDTLDYATPAEQLFRAAPVPVGDEAALPGIAAYGLQLVFGTTPLETIFCPSARVTVPNTLNWGAGKAVEFYVHGADVSQSFAPYADWAKISDGQVSADGRTVSTADGQGFPVLESFGIRLAQ
jgi:hypothetical protein